MARHKPTPEEQAETLKRVEALLSPPARRRREVTARPARRGRRWYWSVLWPEPLPVRRWSAFSFPARAERRSKRFEWGHRIGSTFVTKDDRVMFAQFRRDMILMFSYDYLRARAGYRAMGDLERAVRLMREDFAAVWTLLTPAERNRVGLPDVDHYVTAQVQHEFQERDADRYLSELMKHRPSLDNL